MWSIDGDVPGSLLDNGVCLSVVMLSMVPILMRSCVRIKHKYII